MNAKTTNTGAQEAAAKAAADTLDTMVAAGKESVEAAMKAGNETATETYDAAVAIGEKQAEKSGAAYQSAARLGKENMTAFKASAGAMAAGFEAYGEKVSEYAKATTAEYFDLMSRFMAAKTPEEFASLQMEATTRSMERFMTQSIELNRIATEALSESAAPVKQRYDAVMSEVSKSASD